MRTVRISLSQRVATLAVGLAACCLAHGPAFGEEPAPLTTREIVQRVGDAVVMIEGEGAAGEWRGSGFLLRPENTVVTNLHVIDEAERLRVKFSDGTRVEDVTVRAFDVIQDLAVLEVEPPERAATWPTLELGDTSVLNPGDRLVVISNPMGLENTVTEGIVSAWREPQEEADDERGPPSTAGASLPRCRVLQISADISAGSSGGPVLNTRAEVIGIAQSGFHGVSGLNFAVPVDVVPRLVAERGSLDLATFRRRLDAVRLDLARPLFESARFAYERNERDEALRLTERAIGMFPRYEDALILSARIALDLGQAELAKKRLEKAALVDENNAEAWFLLGLLYDRVSASTNDSSLVLKAEDLYRKALDRDDRHGGAAYHLAVILAGRGLLDEAEELLLVAIEDEASFADAQATLGEIYFARDNYGAAREAFEKALWEDPDHAVGHFGLAMYYTLFGNTTLGDLSGQGPAARHWEAFLRLSSGNPDLAGRRKAALEVVEQHFPQLLDR